MAEEKDKKQKEYEVVKVPIEHELAVTDLEGEVINQIQLLAKIANDVEKIKQNLLG